MSVALHGNLRDFGIGEVFQLIGAQRKTGVLEISNAGERIRIVFDRGAVVSAATEGAYEGAALGDLLVRVGMLPPDRLRAAEKRRESSGESFARALQAETDLSVPQIEEVADLLTRETVFALLRWQRGSFHFTAQAVAGPRDPSRCLPAEQILMDGLRMVDEWRSLDEAARDPEAVLRRTGRFDAYRAANASAPAERLVAAERLFLLLDGRLTVRRVIDLSRLGTFEGARLLSQFRRAGLVEPVDAAALARRGRKRAEPTLGPARSPLRTALALAPFLLLAAVVAAAARGPQASEPASGLAPDPAVGVRLAAEARALRQRIDAFRFATGRWPGDLADVGAPMAGEDERPYYYSLRGETFLLLAPEH